MLNGQRIKLSKYKQIVTIILGMLMAGTSLVEAKEKTINPNHLNAGYLLNKMSSNEQVNFIAGVVEGLAFSRWLKDRPDDTGIKCIYKWAGNKKKWNQIDAFFAKHPEKAIGPLLYILIKKECGQ